VIGGVGPARLAGCSTPAAAVAARPQVHRGSVDCRGSVDRRGCVDSRGCVDTAAPLTTVTPSVGAGSGAAATGSPATCD
jgi:hypothetical protein